ncbi:MAG: ferrous iron transport protein A [Candidatus Thermoplasmatota archaeon]|nr:ferrous iron transport protein A [Candidatus Thermoplasmatota archaeon]MBS3789428.1 ferrous iron transport protein A [Candidatus Thermoplasmatota archaeon]
MKRRSKQTILPELDIREKARIINIEGGRGLKQKLALRGLREGAIIQIISYHGPITVKVNNSTVSIGRGMARKIRVRSLG